MAILVKHLGLVDYQSTYTAMQEFTKQRKIDTPDEIWVLEHLPVFTLGLAGDPSNLHAPSNQIPLVQVDRGGEITYHGPGQTVVYLLLDLKRLGIFVKELVVRIEQALIDTLADYNLKTERHAGAPGIYVAAKSPQHGGAKIAALGLKVTRHCSYHGLALNVDMDLAPFMMINPCGYPDLETIDMRSLGVQTPKSEVANILLKELTDQLK